MASTSKRRRSKGLTDDQILGAIQPCLKSGVDFTDTKLASERRRVTEFYNAERPAPHHKGNSKYVSMDVYDAVESMKAQLLETFSAGSDIVQFSPEDANDVDAAHVATQYTKYQIFKRNDPGFMDSVVHDGLTSRLAVAKVYWHEAVEEVEEEFELVPEEALTALLTDPDVELVEEPEAVFDPNSGVPFFSGRVRRKVRDGYAKIEPVAPEEFIVDPSVKSAEHALDFGGMTHRVERTRSRLIADGIPAKLLDEIGPYDNTLEADQERIARFKSFTTDRIGLPNGTQSEDKSQDIFVVYETYIRLDVKGTGTAQLWRILHCCGKILEKEEVSRHPFLFFVPLPIPHSFYGNNFADRVVPTQTAKTVLTRSILDHAVITNNPRYGVVKGALVNPRELLDNRVGGLVNMTRPDGVFPLQQAPLNPFVFQTIAMLDEDKEDTTGISRLSQGLNKDAVSKQNSQGMVEQLIGASQIRQKIIARNFANQFLKPLFHAVYALVIENEQQEKIVEVAGKFVPIDPRTWREKRDVSIDLRLGYGELDRQVGDYMMIHQLLAADPVVSPNYQYEQRFNLMKKVLEIKGHKAVNDFLPQPETVQPPQPDPLMLAELELKKQEVQINERKMALNEMEAQTRAEIDQMRLDFENRFKAMEYQLKVAEDRRKERETTSRVETAKAEIEMAKQAINKPNAETRTSAIVSPNS